jgi:catabolite regulation protein CreA
LKESETSYLDAAENRAITARQYMSVVVDSNRSLASILNYHHVEEIMKSAQSLFFKKTKLSRYLFSSNMKCRRVSIVALLFFNNSSCFGSWGSSKGLSSDDASV